MIKKLFITSIIIYLGLILLTSSPFQANNLFQDKTNTSVNDNIQSVYAQKNGDDDDDDNGKDDDDDDNDDDNGKDDNDDDDNDDDNGKDDNDDDDNDDDNGKDDNDDDDNDDDNGKDDNDDDDNDDDNGKDDNDDDDDDDNGKDDANENVVKTSLDEGNIPVTNIATSQNESLLSFSPSVGNTTTPALLQPDNQLVDKPSPSTILRN